MILRCVFLFKFTNSFLSNVYQKHSRQHTLNCLRHTTFDFYIVDSSKNTCVRFSSAGIARQHVKLDDFLVLNLAISEFTDIQKCIAVQNISFLFNAFHIAFKTTDYRAQNRYICFIDVLFEGECLLRQNTITNKQRRKQHSCNVFIVKNLVHQSIFILHLY